MNECPGGERKPARKALNELALLRNSEGCAQSGADRPVLKTHVAGFCITKAVLTRPHGTGVAGCNNLPIGLTRHRRARPPRVRGESDQPD